MRLYMYLFSVYDGYSMMLVEETEHNGFGMLKASNDMEAREKAKEEIGFIIKQLDIDCPIIVVEFVRVSIIRVE